MLVFSGCLLSVSLSSLMWLPYLLVFSSCAIHSTNKTRKCRSVGLQNLRSSLYTLYLHNPFPTAFWWNCDTSFHYFWPCLLQTWSTDFNFKLNCTISSVFELFQITPLKSFSINLMTIFVYFTYYPWGFNTFSTYIPKLYLIKVMSYSFLKTFTGVDKKQLGCFYEIDFFMSCSFLLFEKITLFNRFCFLFKKFI